MPGDKDEMEGSSNGDSSIPPIPPIPLDTEASQHEVVPVQADPDLDDHHPNSPNDHEIQEILDSIGNQLKQPNSPEKAGPAASAVDPSSIPSAGVASGSLLHLDPLAFQGVSTLQSGPMGAPGKRRAELGDTLTGDKRVRLDADTSVHDAQAAGSEGLSEEEKKLKIKKLRAEIKRANNALFRFLVTRVTKYKDPKEEKEKNEAIDTSKERIELDIPEIRKMYKDLEDLGDLKFSGVYKNYLNPVSFLNSRKKAHSPGGFKGSDLYNDLLERCTMDLKSIPQPTSGEGGDLTIAGVVQGAVARVGRTEADKEEYKNNSLGGYLEIRKDRWNECETELDKGIIVDECLLKILETFESVKRYYANKARYKDPVSFVEGHEEELFEGGLEFKKVLLEELRGIQPVSIPHSPATASPEEAGPAASAGVTSGYSSHLFPFTTEGSRAVGTQGSKKDGSRSKRKGADAIKSKITHEKKELMIYLATKCDQYDKSSDGTREEILSMSLKEITKYTELVNGVHGYHLSISQSNKNPQLFVENILSLSKTSGVCGRDLHKALLKRLSETQPVSTAHSPAAASPEEAGPAASAVDLPSITSAGVASGSSSRPVLSKEDLESEKREVVRISGSFVNFFMRRVRKWNLFTLEERCNAIDESYEKIESGIPEIRKRYEDLKNLGVPEAEKAIKDYSDPISFLNSRKEGKFKKSELHKALLEKLSETQSVSTPHSPATASPEEVGPAAASAVDLPSITSAGVASRSLPHLDPSAFQGVSTPQPTSGEGRVTITGVVQRAVARAGKRTKVDERKREPFYRKLTKLTGLLRNKEGEWTGSSSEDYKQEVVNECCLSIAAIIKGMVAHYNAVGPWSGLKESTIKKYKDPISFVKGYKGGLSEDRSGFKKALLKRLSEMQPAQTPHSPATASPEEAGPAAASAVDLPSITGVVQRAVARARRTEVDERKYKDMINKKKSLKRRLEVRKKRWNECILESDKKKIVDECLSKILETFESVKYYYEKECNGYTTHDSTKEKYKDPISFVDGFGGRLADEDDPDFKKALLEKLRGGQSVSTPHSPATASPEEAGPAASAVDLPSIPSAEFTSGSFLYPAQRIPTLQSASSIDTSVHDAQAADSEVLPEFDDWSEVFNDPLEEVGPAATSNPYSPDAASPEEAGPAAISDPHSPDADTSVLQHSSRKRKAPSGSGKAPLRSGKAPSGSGKAPLRSGKAPLRSAEDLSSIYGLTQSAPKRARNDRDQPLYQPRHRSSDAHLAASHPLSQKAGSGGVASAWPQIRRPQSSQPRHRPSVPLAASRSLSQEAESVKYGFLQGEKDGAKGSDASVETITKAFGHNKGLKGRLKKMKKKNVARDVARDCMKAYICGYKKSFLSSKLHTEENIRLIGDQDLKFRELMSKYESKDKGDVDDSLLDEDLPNVGGLFSSPKDPDSTMTPRYHRPQESSKHTR